MGRFAIGITTGIALGVALGIGIGAGKRGVDTPQFEVQTYDRYGNPSELYTEVEVRDIRLDEGSVHFEMEAPGGHLLIVPADPKAEFKRTR